MYVRLFHQTAADAVISDSSATPRGLSSLKSGVLFVYKCSSSKYVSDQVYAKKSSFTQSSTIDDVLYAVWSYIYVLIIEA